MSRFVAAIAVLGGVLSVTVASQVPAPETPTFKAEVEYVDVDAVVTDASGAVVKDLRKEDFQIFEDGKSQSIAGFAFVEIPVVTGNRSSDSAAREPDVRSNEEPFAGRIYVLVLDDLHTSSQRAPRVKRAAQQFINEHLSTNDLMAVLQVGGASGGAQEFTSDKRLLLAAVDRFRGQKLQSATLARNELFSAGASTATGTIDDPFDSERSFHALGTTRVLTQVAEKLSAIRGRRKSILFISEGLDYDITDVMSNRSASTILDAMRGAIAAATRSNASIYAIDPRGLTTLGDDTIETGLLADQRAAADDPGAAGAQRQTGIAMSSLRNELQVSQDSLRTLADETNGFAAVNANDFTAAFERIVSANSAYYVLAYYPPSRRRDGKFHQIEVRTSRPGLTIRARRGYAISPNANTKPQRNANKDISPPLLRALNSVVPSTGLKIRLFAAPFIGTAPNTSVVMGLELQGAELALTEGQAVELAFVAVDASGETRADTDSFTFKLPEDAKARIRKTGIRFLKRLNLPPGRYHFRVGVHDRANGAVGTVNYDVELPAFSKLPFSMSGLLVTSKAATGMVTARGDPELQKFMKLPPVGFRTFPQTDDVSVVVEVYDRSGSTPHTVDITTTVRSRDGQVVFERSDQRSSEELQGANGAYVHAITIPVGEFAPGTYGLAVEARSRLGQSASRQIDFIVTR